MRFPSTLTLLACCTIWTVPPGCAADKIELAQMFFTGGTPGYFKMKLDSPSGWVDAVKNSKGGRKVCQSFRLGLQQVQEVFGRVEQMAYGPASPSLLRSRRQAHSSIPER